MNINFDYTLNVLKETLRKEKDMLLVLTNTLSKYKINNDAQGIEYDMSIYTKKMLGFMGGIHVTPGPFSIFRKKVFDDLGIYKKAHNSRNTSTYSRPAIHQHVSTRRNIRPVRLCACRGRRAELRRSLCLCLCVSHVKEPPLPR